MAERKTPEGWEEIAPGMWKPGPELAARLAARPPATRDQLKALIRNYAETSEKAEEIIKDIWEDE